VPHIPKLIQGIVILLSLPGGVISGIAAIVATVSMLFAPLQSYFVMLGSWLLVAGWVWGLTELKRPGLAGRAAWIRVVASLLPTVVLIVVSLLQVV
jgi:hypothetical protein